MLESAVSPEAEGQGRKTFLLWTGESKFREVRGLQARRDMCAGEGGLTGKKRVVQLRK